MNFNDRLSTSLSNYGIFQYKRWVYCVPPVDNANFAWDHCEAVAENYHDNSYGLMATVKSFVECVCLSTLGEFRKSTSS